MSTRALVDFIDQNTGESKRLYHHNDGDPECVGLDLRILVANLNAGWDWGYYGESIDCLAEYIMNRGLCGRRGIDHGYVDGENYDESWIEYFYTISKKGGVYNLTCRDGSGNDVTSEIPAYRIGQYGKRYEVKYLMDEEQFRSRFPDARSDLDYSRRGDARDIEGKWATYHRVLDTKGPAKRRFKPLINLRRK